MWPNSLCDAIIISAAWPLKRNLQTGCFMVIFQTVMVSGHVTPSPHTSITVSSSDASRQERRRWSLLKSHWSWLWPPGRQDPAQCCSAPRTPTLSSSCRWWWCVVLISRSYEVILVTIFICVFSPGSDCVFGRHARGVSCNKQPPANH